MPLFDIFIIWFSSAVYFRAAASLLDISAVRCRHDCFLRCWCRRHWFSSSSSSFFWLRWLLLMPLSLYAMIRHDAFITLLMPALMMPAQRAILMTMPGHYWWLFWFFAEITLSFIYFFIFFAIISLMFFWCPFDADFISSSFAAHCHFDDIFWFRRHAILPIFLFSLFAMPRHMLIIFAADAFAICLMARLLHAFCRFCLMPPAPPLDAMRDKVERAAAAPAAQRAPCAVMLRAPFDDQSDDAALDAYIYFRHCRRALDAFTRAPLMMPPCASALARVIFIFLIAMLGTLITMIFIDLLFSLMPMLSFSFIFSYFLIDCRHAAFAAALLLFSDYFRCFSLRFHFIFIDFSSFLLLALIFLSWLFHFIFSSFRLLPFLMPSPWFLRFHVSLYTAIRHDYFHWCFDISSPMPNIFISCCFLLFAFAFLRHASSFHWCHWRFFDFRHFDAFFSRFLMLILLLYLMPLHFHYFHFSFSLRCCFFDLIFAATQCYAIYADVSRFSLMPHAFAFRLSLLTFD